MKKILMIFIAVLMVFVYGCTRDNIPDALDGYKIVIDKLYNEDKGLNDDIKYIAIDTSMMANLTDETKAKLLKQLENYGLTVLNMTYNELEEQGYIQDLYFKEGVLFKIEDEPMKNNTIKMNVSKWRSGLGAIGYNGLIIKCNNDEWEIIKIGESWIS